VTGPEADLAISQQRTELYHRGVLEADRQFGVAARTVIVTAAGALALSIGPFLGASRPDLTAESVTALRFAWGFLFAAIGLGVVAIVFRYGMVHHRTRASAQHRLGGPKKKRFLRFATLFHWVSIGALFATFAGFRVGLVQLASVARAPLEADGAARDGGQFADLEVTAPAGEARPIER
jgi:hypothetical protein